MAKQKTKSDKTKKVVKKPVEKKKLIISRKIIIGTQLYCDQQKLKLNKDYIVMVNGLYNLPNKMVKLDLRLTPR